MKLYTPKDNKKQAFLRISEAEGAVRKESSITCVAVDEDGGKLVAPLLFQISSSGKLVRFGSIGQEVQKRLGLETTGSGRLPVISNDY